MTERTITIRIAIDIPVDIAADTLAKLTPALTALSSQSLPVQVDNQAAEPMLAEAEQKNADQRAVERQVYEDNRQRYLRNCVQAYRTFRRIAGLYPTTNTAYRLIAEQYDWPATVVRDAIASRKKKITQYLRLRHMLTALRLAKAGQTNQQIADKLGVSQPTANRLLKEAREKQREAAHV